MKVYCAVVDLHRQAGPHPLAVAVCPVLDTTGRPSTNDPLQPTRCIRMQGGELAGTWLCGPGSAKYCTALPGLVVVRGNGKESE